ncbi:2,3-diketo-L-gulonate TRAP transporter small permease protein YiaM [Variovorax sp. PBL-H6]|uniref:TRAP transporter small permease n=1 Tax=Variovorax sp. PBL-H6 TaxID=434009 RepID=UPI00131882A4|nr:TRAP transporter small permease [Variovorax sp. PBL-H6]VTU21739.1 2,3-diketo-L-gulonate TRAP transporter small permease protein YiaM [Variovorax sp. PBL-H6]
MAWLEKLEEGLIALLLASMTAITFGQVVARYLFNYSFVWALELTTVLFAWLIFLGMSYGVRVGAHIGVDAAVKLLGPRAARAVACVAAVLCLLYAVIFVVGGAIYLQKMYSIGIEMQDIPLPQWVPRLVLPFGFSLLALRFCQALYRAIRGRDVRLIGDEAEDALKLRADAPTRSEQE